MIQGDLLKKVQNEVSDSFHTLRLLPKDVSKTLEDVRKGKLRVSVSIKEMKDLIKKSRSHQQ